MFKMKLPTRTAEGGGDETAEDEQERTDSNFHIPCSVTLTDSNKIDDSRGGLRCPFQLDKDTVFEWFGLHLNPAKRTEFMCGLLHMCQPLELRFLGSCLEDIARKDFHVLRDFEIRANSPNDLGILTDITDPVVRSKLLVCLSLLRSENSECAGILFRILSHHVDPALYFKNYGFPVSSCRDLQNLQSHPSYENGDEFGKSAKRFGPPSDFGAGPLEQLALLFTMASLHPAFHFHQRETVRVLLDKVAVALEEEGHHYRHSYSTLVPNMDYLSPSNETSLNDKAQSHHSNQSPPRKAQWEAVYIEKIVLKGISRSKTDREYNFEVKWSDSLSSSITKKHHELEDFLLKLPKEFSTQSFEKGILQLLNQGDKYGSREQERTLREKFLSAPQTFRQEEKVCSFFLSDFSGLRCSHCNPVPLSKPFKEDCSETSSQEEDTEPYILGHRKKPGSKSPSLVTKSSQAESLRVQHSDHNGVPEGKRKGCSLKPDQEHWSRAPAEQYLCDQKWSFSPAIKNETRPLGAERERIRAGDGKIGCISNGAVRPPSAQLVQLPAGKIPVGSLPGAGSGQDTYRETSSESYSSPSSPQHDGRESEDEKDKDTGSHSDDYSRGKPDSFLPCKVAGAFSPMHPSVSRAESPFASSTIPQHPFMHSKPYAVQNGKAAPEAKAPPQATECKMPAGIMVTTTRDEVSLPELSTLPLTPLGLQPPSSTALAAQRFKTAGLPAGPEGCDPSSTGSIAVIPPGPAYLSSLQPAYPSAEPVPHPVPLIECHSKPPSISLSHSLPVATPVMPSVGSMGSPAVSQVQAMVPPAVPTPTPSQSPTQTHSTAQSDSTSHINSTSCGSSSGGAQQQQPTLPQMSCGACGCRGSCGSSHTPNYYFPPQMPQQVLSVPHIFHLTSLAPQSNGAQLPFFPPAPTYASGPPLHTHSDPVLGSQVGYGMPQMAAFNRFYQPIFPLVGMIPGAGSLGSVKKNGNVSCYNCGVSGHYAQDCKQPSIDMAQQGGFRLRYVIPQSSEAPDKAD